MHDPLPTRIYPRPPPGSKESSVCTPEGRGIFMLHPYSPQLPALSCKELLTEARVPVPGPWSARSTFSTVSVPN